MSSGSAKNFFLSGRHEWQRDLIPVLYRMELSMNVDNARQSQNGFVDSPDKRNLLENDYDKEAGRVPGIRSRPLVLRISGADEYSKL
jgi:hypothetical protein